MNGVCFSFKIAVVGETGVGKSSLAKTWQAIPSFDKFLNGYPAPTIEHPLEATQYVDYVPIDVVVKNCSEAAAHRVYLLDTPGAPDRQVLRRGLIEKGSMDDGIHGAILLIDSQKHPDHLEDSLKLISSCIKNECFVMLIHRGGPIPEELQHLGPYVLPMASADLENGLKEETRALINFVETLHKKSEWVRDEADVAKKELEKQINIAQSRRNARTLPSRRIQYQFFPEKSPEAKTELRVGLFGGPNTGKSTFVTSLLDGFTLYDYEATPRLEVGTFSLNFPPGERVNITMFDGPEVEKQPLLAIGLVFIDVSSSFALENAAAAVDDFSKNPPPLIVVLATKNDVGAIVSDDEINAFAAELGAPLEQLDPRRNNEELFARIVTAAMDNDTAMRRKLERERIFYEATVTTKDIELPHTEAEMWALFNTYDIDGNGYIDAKEAEKLYKDFDKTGFGDFWQAMAKMKEQSRAMKDDKKLTFDQFSILMCGIAKM